MSSNIELDTQTNNFDLTDFLEDVMHNPQSVFVLEHSSGKHAVNHDARGLDGLALFNTREGAIKFMGFIQEVGWTLKDIQLEDALMLALTKKDINGNPLRFAMLCDQPNEQTPELIPLG